MSSSALLPRREPIAFSSPVDSPLLPIIEAMLDPLPENIPSELKELPTWVLWAAKPSPSQDDPQHISKPPLRTTLYMAATNKPASWSSFDEVVLAFKRYRGAYKAIENSPAWVRGIGFMLQASQGVVGLDFDHARKKDGSPQEWAKPVIDALLAAGAYVEISPSGNGFRSFLHGSLSKTSNKFTSPDKTAALEIYSDSRFLTVTGHTLAQSGSSLIEDPSGKLLSFVFETGKGLKGSTERKAAGATSLPSKPHAGGRPRKKTANDLSDADILSRIRSSKASSLWASLFDANPGGDASSNEMILCNSAAFWFGPDPARIDRIMRQSALLQAPGRLEKWDKVHNSDGRTYGQITIDKALQQASSFYLNKLREKKTPPPATRIEQEDGDIPLIQVQPGKLLQAVEQLEKLLIAGCVFQRNGFLVRLRRLPEDREKKDRNHKLISKRPAGDLLVDVLTKSSAVPTLAPYANYEKWSAKREEWYATDIPTNVISALLESAEWPHVRPLLGVSASPVVFPDGSIDAKPGYNEDSGLFLDLAPELLSSLWIGAPFAQEMSVQIAKEWIDAALEEFPFVSDTDKAVAISSLLLSVTRPGIDHAPMTAISADCPGTGKTELCNLIGRISTGKIPSCIDYSEDDTELKKKLFSHLLEGATVTVIDNVKPGVPVNNSVLNQILTGNTITDRILGLSKTATVSTSSIWLANGNHLAVTQDMLRRTILCRLHREEEIPEQHVFSRNLEEWSLEHRGDLISACVVLLRNAIQGGAANDLPSRYAGFDKWSQTVRATVLKYWGVDPLDSQKTLRAEDPIREAALAFLEAWYDLYGDKGVSAKDLVDVNDFSSPTLVNALCDLFDVPYPSGSEKPAVLPRELGRWLRNTAGQVIGGYMVLEKREKTHTKIKTWCVRKKG